MVGGFVFYIFSSSLAPVLLYLIPFLSFFSFWCINTASIQAAWDGEIRAHPTICVSCVN